MPGITIRLTDGTYTLIAEEATAQGLSITAFIREATLIRAWVLRMRRLDLNYEDEVAEIREWLRTQDGRSR